MLDYLAYGAIGIAMATTILTFRLLASEQKKDHPNESILKMIKLFMGLTIFFSLFFGVVELLQGSGEETPTTIPTTIRELKSQSSDFLLSGDDLGNVSVKMIDTAGQEHTIGNLSDRTFGVVKEREKRSEWHVRFGAMKLGRINTAWNLWDLRNDDKTFAYLKQWSPIDKANSKLMFRIDSIRLAEDKSSEHGNYEFSVRFGEMDDNGDISPSKGVFTFYSSFNGKIDPFNYVPLNKSDWKNEYYAGLGLGQPTKTTTHAPPGTPVDGVSWNRVQRFNGSVIQMNLKNQ